MAGSLNYSEFLAKTGPEPVDLPIASARGSWLYSQDGRKYLDLISGIGVSHLGHGHPFILKRIREQLDQHSHVMVFGEYPQKIQDLLAEKVTGLLGKPLDKIFFTNSGTEANEAALKIAKRYTGRTELISFIGAYHGSTQGSLSVSGNESRKRSFRPLLPDVRFLRFNHIEDLSQISKRTAAVIIEPIQGDAGVRIPDPDYLSALSDRCKQSGSLLIMDEVQTGFGRTGKWFAHQHYDMKPDIITMGKAMGAGLPLAAFAARADIMDCLTSDPPLGHITTFGGNPVCCAASLGGIEVIETERVLESVEEKGQLFESKLDHPRIKAIRRKGLMLAIDLESEDQVNRTVASCREKGSLIYWFLSTKYSFRLAPPLNISNEEIEKGCNDILAALDEI